MKTWMVATLATLVVSPLPFASGQDYPNKAIRIIVPFPPGGPTDIIGRAIAQKLSEQLRQPVITDNRGGASGIIGTELAARATPDGYTLLMAGNAPLLLNPLLFKKLPYDPQDFASVSLIGTSPSILITHPSLPVKTAKDVIALAKAQPGHLNYASSGSGTMPHLAGELFKSMAGVDIVHVPYKGGGPAMVDLIAGQTNMYFSGITSALPLVKDGRLRGIGVTTAKRSRFMPDTPTIAESGLPGYEVGNVYMIAAPAATPQPIIKRLNSEIVKALAATEIRKRFAELATDLVGSTPEELTAHSRREIATWAKVIKSAGIRLE